MLSAQKSVQSIADQKSSIRGSGPASEVSDGRLKLVLPQHIRIRNASTSSQAALEKLIALASQAEASKGYETRYTERPSLVRSSTAQPKTPRKLSKEVASSEALTRLAADSGIASNSSLHTVIVKTNHDEHAPEKLSRAITDLERLLDEAVQLAGNSAEVDEARVKEPLSDEGENRLPTQEHDRDLPAGSSSTAPR